MPRIRKWGWFELLLLLAVTLTAGLAVYIALSSLL